METTININDPKPHVAQPVAVPTPPVPGSVMPPKPKRKIPKALLWVGIGAILLVVALLVVKLFSGRSQSKEEIVWWGLWEDSTIVGPIITEYESANPGVKIVYQRQSQQDYRERLTNAIAKGVAPDIFRFHNSWLPMLEDELTPLPADVMSASEFVETFYPVATSDLSGSSGIMGIPLMYDSLTLFINQDIFESEGKTPPTTWDELRSLALELTRKDEQGAITRSGVALGRVENVDHWQEILGLMMLQNGADLANPTDKLASDALTFFTLFSTDDKVWDATLPNSTTAFAGGNLAMYFAPSWRAFEISEQNPSLKFKTVKVPQLPKSTSTQPDVAYASYWVEGVWKKSAKSEEAWKFLEFVSSRDSLSKLYSNASKTRAFGEPYPRVDMAELLIAHPIIGSVVSSAADGQSWYLHSRTFDGPTGINSLVSKYYEDAINAVVSGRVSAEKALVTTANGIAQVLSQYGLR